MRDTVTAPFTREYLSDHKTVTFSSVLAVAHGLGVLPKLVQVVFVNVSSEAGYSTGDEIPIYGTMGETNSSASGLLVTADATNITVVIGSGPTIYNKATAGASAMTASNWNLIIRCWA